MSPTINIWCHCEYNKYKETYNFPTKYKGRTYSKQSSMAHRCLNYSILINPCSDRYLVGLILGSISPWCLVGSILGSISTLFDWSSIASGLGLFSPWLIGLVIGWIRQLDLNWVVAWWISSKILKMCRQSDSQPAL